MPARARPVSHPAADPPDGRPGLLRSLQGLAATLVATGRTRLELLANEFEVQKLLALQLLLLSQALMFCLALAVLLAVALLTMVLWEQRQLVLSFFCAVFGAAAALCYGQLKRLLNPPQAAFSASLTELQEDIRRLKKAASHAGAPD